MKANAPEKIYLEWYREGDKIYRDWCITPKTNNEPVEYTRTDAFIEKACEWLNKELPITDLSPSNMLDITFNVFDKENKKVFIESFRKYMGEK